MKLSVAWMSTVNPGGCSWLHAIVQIDKRSEDDGRKAIQVALPGGGLIIDTPGFRELGMWGTERGVGAACADRGELASSCRDRDCRHEAEPGCAVRAAVEAGTLPAGRLESYHRLLRELRHVEAKVDQRTALEEKRRWRSIHQLAKKFRPRE